MIRRRISLAPARLGTTLLFLALMALAACKRLPTGASTGVVPLPSGALPVAATALPTTSPLPAPLPGARAPQSFADLAAKADPAVVFVKTLQERRGASGRRRVIGEGVGTAFVYDPNGLIITNNHVIDEASEIHVIFGRKREVKATVVGRDPRTDIAVLRVEEKNLPYLPLGDSDALRVGDWVLAIGNPFALAHTVSAGILSAKGRTIADVKGRIIIGYHTVTSTLYVNGVPAAPGTLA